MTNTEQFVGVLLVGEKDGQYILKDTKAVRGQIDLIYLKKENTRYILENYPQYQKNLLISKQVANEKFPNMNWVSIKEI
ncbi:hypothetical protein VMHJH2_09545 [Streptococcus uberis]|uniref:hypothetical protein n=1 Tax=Streptococcus uberis TaxID=1349 RepID=UPI00214FC85A|nr:hypothetical protein [Streptococcus uberis]MCR4258762.1 hypothetical protein [Streptococcus uberis]